MSHPSLSDLAAQCIRCGFCLESCPTYLETGLETESPRGRIYLARSADARTIPWRAAQPHLDACLGCRACETACPSGVRYGALIEEAKARLRDEGLADPRQDRLISAATDAKKMARNAVLAEFLPGDSIPAPLARFALGVDAELPKPKAQTIAEWPEIQVEKSARGTAALLEGCAMKVLFPRVHQATRNLLRRCGLEVEAVAAPCCGALHAHSGRLDEGREMARDVFASTPHPIVVNSAGCGSHLKDVIDQINPQRVFDLSEFLVASGLLEKLASARGFQKRDPLRITYHDACHLAHGQKIVDAPRELLRAVPGIELIDLPESAVCCGSAGLYSYLHPAMAGRLLGRKLKNVEETTAQIVVLGNPGCHSWIEFGTQRAQMRIEVMHLAELLESAFAGLPSELQTHLGNGA